MNTITVTELSEKMRSKTKPFVIDVRTPAEYKAVNAKGMRNFPIESIKAHMSELNNVDEVYVICHSGGRSQMVCEDMMLHGMHHLINVTGGMQAWEAAGLPVKKSGKWAMPIMQQVMSIAGALILLGSLGALYIEPALIWLSVFVGAGLLFAGLSGKCLMGELLGKMPWNQ